VGTSNYLGRPCPGEWGLLLIDHGIEELEPLVQANTLLLARGLVQHFPTLTSPLTIEE